MDNEEIKNEGSGEEVGESGTGAVEEAKTPEGNSEGNGEAGEEPEHVEPQR